jgi:alpha-mannosidase
MPRLSRLADVQKLDCAHIDHAIRKVKAAIWTPISPLRVTVWTSAEPLPFAERAKGRPRQLAAGARWGGFLDCAWFRFQGEVPARAAGSRTVARIDMNGELCVRDKRGEPVLGLTSSTYAFFRLFGDPDKKNVLISAKATGRERVDIWADGGNNQEDPLACGTVGSASICIERLDLKALYYDCEVLASALESLPDDTARAAAVRDGLRRAADLLDDLSPRQVLRARAILAPLLRAGSGGRSLTLTAIGNAHIDTIWLWPARETIRKCARTFSTALDLMDRYPEYVFGASQPQQYAWMKEHHPGLYSRIKRRVR